MLEGLCKRNALRFCFPAVLLLFTLALFLQPARAMAEENAQRPLVEGELRLDAYYSSFDLYLSLTDKPIPDVGTKGEMAIYRDLLLRSYIPTYAVLEVSVNPLPITGVYLRSNFNKFYESLDINSFNAVRAVTAGFKEPYAISLFLGNVVKYHSPSSKNIGSNRGYMGYLISYGDYHILDNRLIDDQWYEFEWKIKGDWETEQRRIHWSFRIGEKIHENPDIADTLYISLRRSRLDFGASAASFLNNSGFEYTVELDDDNLEVLSHNFLIEKKFPLKASRTGLSLAIGFIWDQGGKYTGSLQKEQEEEFQIIIRPNIEF